MTEEATYIAIVNHAPLDSASREQNRSDQSGHRIEERYKAFESFEQAWGWVRSHENKGHFRGAAVWPLDELDSLRFSIEGMERQTFSVSKGINVTLGPAEGKLHSLRTVRK